MDKMKQGYYWAIFREGIPLWEVVWVTGKNPSSVYRMGRNPIYSVDEFRDFTSINLPVEQCAMGNQTRGRND